MIGLWRAAVPWTGFMGYEIYTKTSLTLILGNDSLIWPHLERPLRNNRSVGDGPAACDLSSDGLERADHAEAVTVLVPLLEVLAFGLLDPVIWVAAVPGHNCDDIWTHVYGDMQERGPTHRHMVRFVRRLLATITYETVLDVGCGPGHNRSLLTAGREPLAYVGIDVSPLAVQRAREAAEGDLLVVDIQEGSPDGCWDLVYSSLLLEHLPDDVAALRHMRAVTGKYLLVTTMGDDYRRYQAWEERVGHVRNHARGELEAKLRDAGLSLLKVTQWGFPFYSPMARTLQRRSELGTGEFGVAARLAAAAMYYTYFSNSRRRGDLLIALAVPDREGSALVT
jgi:SAM-dependent methyltransferase